MRNYLDSEKTRLEKVVCNRCGRELKLVNGVVQEGIFEGDIRWGYFSGRDGERHQFDLCEDCYIKMIKSFTVPVTVLEQTELI